MLKRVTFSKVKKLNNKTEWPPRRSTFKGIYNAEKDNCDTELAIYIN